MRISMILLAIFLALFGLLQISNIHFEQEGFVLGALALAASIFLFVDR